MKLEDLNEDTLVDAIEEWWELQLQSKELVKKEMNFRKALAGFMEPTGIPGTYERGFTSFTVQLKLNVGYRLDKEVLASLYEDFNEYEKDAIKFPPLFSLTNYKTIPEEQRQRLDDCLIVSPAAPNLKLTWRSEDD